jgi:tetratricopeptide (TPR) repeat protein
MNRKVLLGVVVGLLAGVVAGGFGGLALAERERAESADAALLAAHQAFQAGSYDKAIELAFAATDRRPGFYSAYEIVADSYAKGNDGARARAFYQRSLEALGANGGGSGSAATAKTPEQVEFEKKRIASKLKALKTTDDVLQDKRSAVTGGSSP